MLTLEINNSTSKISGFTNQQLSELKTLLSYDIDQQAAYFSSSFRSTKRYLIDTKGNFPTGLLYLVENYIESIISTLPAYRRTDKREEPAPRINYNLKLGLTPYPEQVDAVIACISSHRGTVSAVTGFGKSVTMALLVNALAVKTLIVVPNLGLKQQLKDSFTRYFGNLNNITIENIDSPTLHEHGDYDCLIIDEAHHSAAKTYRTLNKKMWNGIYFRFFFTATAFRSRDEEQILFESVAGLIIYQIGYKEAAAKGYVVPVEAYYIDLPKSSTIGYTWAQVYSDLVVNNKLRNSVIQKLIQNLNAAKTPTLCLVKEIAHGHYLHDPVYSSFVKGENDDNKHTIDAFNNTKKTTLIGTTGVLGEGVDTRPAEYIIIAGLGKSKNQFMQQVGRGLRVYPGKESCKIILFRDTSHNWTLAHFKAQAKILKDEYGVTPIKLDFGM